MAALTASMLVASGCSSNPHGPTGCTPGMVSSCACFGGAFGTQTCDSTGAFGACRCVGSDAGVRGDTGPSGFCGDHFCNSTTESCTSCPTDCGACPTCSLPPGASCASASSPCCGDTALTTRGICANLTGTGQCSALCTTGADCNSGCCYALSNGQSACGATLLGREGDSCEHSGCCSGSLVCTRGVCTRPGPYLPPGAACTSSAQCAGDAALTTQGVCANLFGAGNVCHALCTTGSGCSSGCCYPLTSGQGACGAIDLGPRGASCSSSLCCQAYCSGGYCT